jgi:hypothetical protein
MGNITTLNKAEEKGLNIRKNGTFKSNAALRRDMMDGLNELSENEYIASDPNISKRI